MYPEYYYSETVKWKEDFVNALKELDELYPLEKAYEPPPTIPMHGLHDLFNDRSGLQDVQYGQPSGLQNIANTHLQQQLGAYGQIQNNPYLSAIIRNI